MLESQFQTAFERDVNAAYADQITTLGTGYAAALDRALQEATKAGRLDEAIALREEKQRFTTHKFMPSIDPTGLHQAVVRLRTTYRTAEKTYALQKDATSLPLYDRYIEVLTALETEFMAQGRSADATRVRTKRDDVVARRKQRAAKVPAGTAVLPPSPATPAKLMLFDGQSLNGWRVVGDADSFTVISGEIRSNKKPGNLIYVGSSGNTPSWQDFTLELKVKATKSSNSGVWLHLPEPTTIINRKVTGFEVNIDSNTATGTILGAVDFNSGRPLSSKLESGFFGSQKQPPGPSLADQWITMRINARSGLVTVWLDGQQVNQWALPDGWAPPPDKGYVQAFKGTIGLQSLSGTVAFKDIAIELL
jgi:hypothetical protein